MLRAFAALAAVLSVTGAGAGGAAAELLSSRPITIVIPFTPGASSDTLQRIVDKKVSENTGQTLVVESRPGGSGVIAAAVVKQATADGHTLLQANAATHASNTSLYATLPYNPIKDFRPITLLWSFPQLLAVPPDSTAKSVSDLVALAKSKPGGLSFASQGTGSGGHLLGEMFKLRTAANMVRSGTPPRRGNSSPLSAPRPSAWASSCARSAQRRSEMLAGLRPAARGDAVSTADMVVSLFRAR